MVRGSNCESLTPTRGSDRHLSGNPQPYPEYKYTHASRYHNYSCIVYIIKRSNLTKHIIVKRL